MKTDLSGCPPCIRLFRLFVLQRRDTMKPVAKPDALPPSAETQSGGENGGVIADEAVTSIASLPAVRVQADMRSLPLTVLTVLAVIFVLHWAGGFHSADVGRDDQLCTFSPSST